MGALAARRPPRALRPRLAPDRGVRRASARRSPPRACSAPTPTPPPRLAALRAGGLRAAFGSDGKSIQVGLAAATGVAAARLAAAGADGAAPTAIAAAWRDAYGGRVGRARRRPDAGDRRRTGSRRGRAACRPTARSSARSASATCPTARSPCSPTRSRARRPATTRVETPLQAKFSIPYTTAFTLLHGGPRVDDFAALDDAAQELAERIEVRTDPALGESEFALLAGDEELARVDAARGSPQHPLSPERAARQGARPRRRSLRRARRRRGLPPRGSSLTRLG